MTFGRKEIGEIGPRGSTTRMKFNVEESLKGSVGEFAYIDTPDLVDEHRSAAKSPSRAEMTLYLKDISSYADNLPPARVFGKEQRVPDRRRCS